MWSHPQVLSTAWVDEGGDRQTLWWGSGPGGGGRKCRAVSGGGDGSETEILEMWEGADAGADRVALCPHRLGVRGRLIFSISSFCIQIYTNISSDSHCGYF